MANYVTYIGETKILLEAPVGAAFAKQDLDVLPDPEKAIENVISSIRLVAKHMAKEVGPALRGSGAAFELSFAVRADNTGLVMISEQANLGQFQCTMKWPPTRPAAKPAALPNRSS